MTSHLIAPSVRSIEVKICRSGKVEDLRPITNVIHFDVQYHNTEQEFERFTICCFVGLEVEGMDEETRASFCRKGYRRKRTAFTQEQLTRLEGAFEFNKYPGIELRDALAQELEVREGRIQVKEHDEVF
jgi:hypothetical protein